MVDRAPYHRMPEQGSTSVVVDQVRTKSERRGCELKNKAYMLIMGRPSGCLELVQLCARVDVG